VEQHQAEPGDQAHHRPVAAGDARAGRQADHLAPGRGQRAGQRGAQLAARGVGELDDAVAVDHEHAILAGRHAPARGELGDLAAQSARRPDGELDVVVGPERPQPGVRGDEQDRPEPA
jgi:hypothetical protein